MDPSLQRDRRSSRAEKDRRTNDASYERMRSYSRSPSPDRSPIRSRHRSPRSSHHNRPRSRSRSPRPTRQSRYCSRSRSPRALRQTRRPSHSRSPKHLRRRSYSRSPDARPRIRRRSRNRSRSRTPEPRTRKSHQALPSQAASFGLLTNGETNEKPAPEKQKPNYEPTGLLAREANTVKGTSTVLKYHEPAREARKPPADQPWRMFVFDSGENSAAQGDRAQDTIHLYTRSCWLVGRDRSVVDISLETTSASKQHAVIQFRHRRDKYEYGDLVESVKPYVIDLESQNGTLLNGTKIEPSRYVELRDGDMLKFGLASKEYVLMLPPPDTA